MVARRHPRIACVTGNGRCRIDVRVPCPYWTALFFPVWIGFWIGAAVLVIREVSKGDFSSLDLVGWLCCAVLLVPLFWAMYVYLWNIRGIERICVDNRYVTLQRRLGPFVVRSIGMSHPVTGRYRPREFLNIEEFSCNLWGGRIVFTPATGEAYRWGLQLTHAELHEIMALFEDCCRVTERGRQAIHAPDAG